jgi:hypothetical protein
MERQDLIKTLANSYFNFLFLNGQAFKNKDYEIGLKEGKNKFLSNLAISKTGKYKIDSTDFISEAAYKQLIAGNTSNLVYEHMVPKTKYIQEPLEKEAMNNQLNYEKVFHTLNKYWFTCLITKDEDKKLNSLNLRNKMPSDWDGLNIFARYSAAKIKLHQK